MKIRRAKLRDKGQILLLVKKFYSKNSPINVKVWKKSYKKFVNFIYVYEINKKIVAYITFTPFKDYLYIGDLYVLKKFRRRRIAITLLKKIDNLKRKFNKKYLLVTNRKKDKPAFKLYTKFGFKIKGLKNKKSWILKK